MYTFTQVLLELQVATYFPRTFICNIEITKNQNNTTFVANVHCDQIQFHWSLGNWKNTAVFP